MSDLHYSLRFLVLFVAIPFGGAIGTIDSCSLSSRVGGAGERLDAVCNDVASTYTEVWKIDHDALEHINAEVLREPLVRILPTGGIVLVSLGVLFWLPAIFNHSIVLGNSVGNKSPAYLAGRLRASA